MKKIAISLLCLIAFGACNQTPKSDSENIASEEAQETKNNYPELLTAALEAHGGIDQWNSFSTMQYDLSMAGNDQTETHIIDLNKRLVRINSENFTIGFDGKEVWASPTIEATGKNSPRFYHNLFFYFFAIPYVLADPGINYDDLGTVKIMDKEYRALKVSFNEGVGDADEDLYIAHFNPETFKLELLLYTVTYYTGEKHENYNALKYGAYKNVNGLLFPMSLKGHKYDSGKIGDLRYDVTFSNVALSKEPAVDSLFVMPEGAEVDSLKVN
ncbi:DUF6503 family protein [Fulvivirga lutea]|uniref:Outer membrane lipoprotein-sorting protein n=1 Tax=Fulvivirga lutea TaxID=2810512 RepID=A0A974ZZW5_9BACT|nr:DUF6503 family protein [Fulvivirga lutea]QSE96580.1 hypothetical protein JR347_13355 [Fulvivirga lutea]